MAFPQALSIWPAWAGVMPSQSPRTLYELSKCLSAMCILPQLLSSQAFCTSAVCPSCCPLPRLPESVLEPLSTFSKTLPSPGKTESGKTKASFCVGPSRKLPELGETQNTVLGGLYSPSGTSNQCQKCVPSSSYPHSTSLQCGEWYVGNLKHHST